MTQLVTVFEQLGAEHKVLVAEVEGVTALPDGEGADGHRLVARSWRRMRNGRHPGLLDRGEGRWKKMRSGSRAAPARTGSGTDPSTVRLGTGAGRGLAPAHRPPPRPGTRGPAAGAQRTVTAAVVAEPLVQAYRWAVTFTVSLWPLSALTGTYVDLVAPVMAVPSRFQAYV
ncbi:hypothetical protein QFZ49_005225 [Streptomyces turgidiscabies]|uniref:Uncharacterized protein n=1 Tax=Streptomyces turgidiscabies TaxID=85558 RepID=A0ABU0RTY7_9ACTN|nr:hypothetical protein [Streptomyces turgidiscabies]